MQQPNILWIYIEDQDPRYGCYGETLVDTPHIDELAQSGIVFERAYSPAPVCSPSRSAVITGSYAIRNGTHVQRSSRFPGEEIYLPEDQKTIPELFRDAGYFTFNRGKDDYNFANDRAALYSTGNDPREPDGKVNGGVGLQSGSGRFEDCPDDQPFFAQIQTNGGKDGYSAEQARGVLQGLGVDDPRVVDPDDVHVPPQYPDIPEMRDMVADQLSTMLISDILVRDILQEVREMGRWDNTVIFLVSDHGALFPRAKQMCYEEGLHVPLMIAAPGMPSLHATITPGTRRQAPVATLDIGATSLRLAGIDVPDYMDTRDLLDGPQREHVLSARDRCEWVVDRTRSVIGARYHYIRNYMTDRPVCQGNFRFRWPAVIKTEAMYASGELTPAQAAPYGPRPREELYDLDNDPHELVNLADRPDLETVMQDMRGLARGLAQGDG
ncbi:MAG: sulfatase [Pseudomonadota bacterium]